jgi:hypothetical protein
MTNSFAGRAALAALLALPALALAAPGADSAYLTDTQHSYVQDATSEGIGQVNMITCFMSAMRLDALVNQGPYIALLDQQKCDPNARSSSSNSGATGSATQAANYMTATVNSTRASNADPMIANIWIDQTDSGNTSLIYLRVSATAPPTSTNAYGQFRLDFCGKDPLAGGACKMHGFLQGAASGLTFFEEDVGANANSQALQLTTASTTSGSGRLAMSDPNQQGAYDFAYDQNLFRRSDGTNDQCFSRDATDPQTGLSVWRYGMYDAATGAQVTRNSGFPIEFTSGGTTYQGFLGYGGLSLPPDALAVLNNGATVSKVDYSSGSAPTRTAYTVVTSPGKLTKYTKRSRTLQQIDRIHFNTFVGDVTNFYAGAVANSQYELFWDDSNGVFKVTGIVNCGGNGCQTQTLSSEQAVDAQFWLAQGGISGWSQSLGGELFIDLTAVSDPVPSASVPVVYRSQDLVYPSDLPPALYCVRDCPTVASMAAFFQPGSQLFSPFDPATANNWNPTVPQDVVAFTTDPVAVTLRDATGQPVVLTGAVQLPPQFQNGLRSGRLFVNLADAECSPGSLTYCDSKVSSLDVYYGWETGPNSYNQFAAVKDSSGTFVNFDPPLQVNYTVPMGAAYGTYAGTTLVLQYGGFGDLWGIPGACVSALTNATVSCDTPNARYVPNFVIPFDATLGMVTDVSDPSVTYLVKWLEREIRFATKNLSDCTLANLALPTGSLALPTVADVQDPSDASSSIYIGAKPVVTAPPRVIQGVVEY